MEHLARLVRHLSRTGAGAGTAFLFAIMFLMTITVVARASGVSLPGTYEMVVLLVIVPVAFALFQSTLEEGHVTIKFLVDRLGPTTRAVLARFAWVVTLVGWSLMTITGLRITLEKGLDERSEVLGVPYLPFRIVWLLGLALACAAAVIHLLRVSRR